MARKNSKAVRVTYRHGIRGKVRSVNKRFNEFITFFNEKHEEKRQRHPPPGLG